MRDPSGEFIPLVIVGAIVGSAISSAVYAATTKNFSWKGLAAAAVGGAIAGGIGVIATPIASSIGLGTGILGTGIVNAGAGALAATATAALDPCQNLTLGYIASSAAAGALGGYIGGKIFPIKGMSNFKQVGFPRTWRGVIPGSMGINAKNAIYRGGSVSVGIGAIIPAYVQ